MEKNANDIQTVNCSSCNAEIPPGNQFCSNCGKPVGSNENSDQNICPKCFTELDPSLRFCTECGSEIKQTVSSDQTTTCPKCFAEMEPGLRFCTECGSEIKRTVSADQATTCPKCFAEVEPGLRFCTECGSEIKRTVSADQATTCPKCFAEMEPGLRFCTECSTPLINEDNSSTSINEKLRQRRESEGKSAPPREETLDSVVESGKGLMKGLGGFMNKAAKSIDQSIENNRQSSASSRNIPKNTTKSDENLGYLVCDACGGYYQLEQGESPDDFEDVCDCGGKYRYQTEL